MSTSLEIAIIGMAGRFPGADSIESLWRNLCDGKESIVDLSEAELRDAGVPDRTLARAEYVRRSAPLEGADRFDPAFFGYTDHEAAQLDPQHRQFLECAFEAFERAGIDPARLDERVGVFGGSSLNGYLFHVLSPTGRVESAEDMAALLALDKDFLTTRVSYKLNLRGPSVAVQTACSTSLVAVHLACQSLLLGECELALAGGVSIGVPQHAGYLHQEGGIASPDGHCRAFDRDARGTVAGSGVGVVLLKRLSDALADGDPIEAVVLGSAINNDGRDKAGFTAPSVAGQARAIRDAHELAGICADTIAYQEAHGTGTPLGDPIEVAALTQAYRASSERAQFCALGSLKTNLGHLDAAAGVAGLIKAALVLKHAHVPASLHYRAPNPAIDFASSPFFVAGEARALPRGQAPLRAGVSSFGIGGTNAHVVLEESPARSRTEDAFPSLLRVSARSPEKLEALRHALADALARDPALPVRDVAHTLAHGRRAFSHRWACRVDSRSDAIARLRSGSRAVQARDRRPVAFLFPGQGSQQVDAGRALYARSSVFREALDLCAALLRFDLRALLHPAPDEAETAARRLGETSFTQPVSFALSYALARTVMSLGVAPCALLGHSVGEYVAACIGGTLTLADAVALVALRGQLMQATPDGAMLAVAAAEREVAPYLGTELALAAVNAPRQCVLAGAHDAIAQVEHALAAAGLATRRVQVSRAFHSAAMDGVLETFRAAVARVTLRAPAQPWISNVTGQPIAPERAVDPAYWVQHLRHTVRFADGLAHVVEAHPDALLLELGSGATLTAFARAVAPASAKASLLAADQDPEALLWEHGAVPAGAEPGRRVALPTTPFEHKRCWASPRPVAEVAASRGPASWLHVPAYQRTGALVAQTASGDWQLLGADAALARALSLPLRDVAGDYARDVLLDASSLAHPLERFVEVARALAGRPGARLLVLTQGACDVLGSESLRPDLATLLGAVRSAVHELPGLSVRLVDHDGDARFALAEAREREAEPVVAHRAGQRWVPRMVAQKPRATDVLRPRGVYLITGGLGGVGRAIAAHLVEHAEAQVALVGRTVPQGLVLPRGMIAIAADVTCREAMQRALAQIAAQLGPLHGVIHAAGETRGGLIEALDAATLTRELAAKVEGAKILASLLEGQPLDFLAYCSSLSAWSGGFAQAGYAAANAFLDAHAAALHRRGVPAVSVALDRFRGLGMAARAQAQLAQLGLAEAGMRSEEGVLAFLLALGLRQPGVVVSRQPVQGLPEDDVATALAARGTPSPSTASSLTEIEDAMARLWATTFGLAAVDRDADFYALGGESLLALQLLDAVRATFGVELPLAQFFEHRSVTALARAVLDAKRATPGVDAEPALVALPRRGRKIARGDGT